MNIYKRIKDGDKSAFDTFFKEHYTPLCRYAHKYVFDLHECEDIVQNIFVKLWNNRSTTIVTTSLKSFLYTSVRNSSIDFIRKQLKLKRVDMDVIEDLEDELCENVSQDAIDGIKAAIETLPDKCQTIFRMSKEEGLSYKEIATDLAITPKTVENQMGIALKKIRTHLKTNNMQALLLLFV